MRGTITRIIPTKGYAFVRGDDAISRFAHARSFLPDASAFDLVREGQAVEFDAVHDPTGKQGGARAVNLVVLPAGYAVDKL